MKHAWSFQRWKKRYFVLSDHKLQVYKQLKVSAFATKKRKDFFFVAFCCSIQHVHSLIFFYCWLRQKRVSIQLTTGTSVRVCRAKGKKITLRAELLHLHGTILGEGSVALILNLSHM